MTEEPRLAEGSERLLSLDAFRGFVIAGMLLVNMTWGEAAWFESEPWSGLAMQLAHVPWNDPVQGATFTDLVFPWFLFIMGAAVPLSMRSGRGRSRSRVRLAFVTVRRGVVIYLLGIVITHANTWTTRPMAWADLLSWNILQIIGMAYIVAVLVGMLPRLWWWVFVGAVLGVKWGVMTLIDSEWVRQTLAEGSNPLGPRLADGATGAGTFNAFDDIKRLLNREHIDAGVSPWDRRLVGWIGGLQQVLPAAAIAMLGALSVDWLLKPERRRWVRGLGLVFAGACAVGVSLLLSFGYAAEGGGLLGRFTVPASKWFFSPAYCLLSAGTGAVLLGVFYLLIDGAGWKRLAVPWRTFGVNALALYVGAELSHKLVFSQWLAAGPEDLEGAVPGVVTAWVDWLMIDWFGEPPPSLAWIGGLSWAVIWLFGWWIICRYLERRSIFIKV